MESVGIVVPHDMALDRELWRWTPEDVTLLLTRTPYSPLAVTTELVEDLGDPEMIARAATDLVAVEPLAYAYGCTSGSFIYGVAGERAITDAITTATGRPAVTTSGSMVAAVTELGLRVVAVADPYDRRVSDAFVRYLNEAAVDVVEATYLGLTREIWRVDPDVIWNLLLAADRPEAECLLVACTNVVTYDLIRRVEAVIDKPVITANQATMWGLLRLIGRTPVGPGQRLFSAGHGLVGCAS
ncbi:Asp/Glu racemase [Microlunatus sp. Gsoil 973]|jgi:maleate isomerase|uniref:maleate cis-trans isomerase family protein n=1 Tax=Microlunatus sp. Gsoil 973 TaxID=2672569 RepID=UPI0012B46A0A|nr:Asp/Glu racemase [Microlunatus sp. Gsoil 973]QGN33062.1 Asp/Glu racemase [Microlunatus sp. Gsoil 973]